MKFLMLTIIIFVQQNNYVSCDFYESMNTMFTDFAGNFMSTVRTIRDQVKSLFQSRAVNKATPLPSIKSVRKIQFNKIFSHFTEMAATEKENELPEYESLKEEPTAYMATPQLASFDGKKMESHVVTTKDGYLLTIHRLSPSRNISQKFANQTIILHHGLLGSSADWILLGPTKSLPYLLSDAGYDVWMANARGNYYSRGHTWKKIYSIEFWQFSWQEIGQFDLAAVIDYIRQVKGFTNKTHEKIDYIGHSMGATTLLVLLSTSPNYNNYLRMGILLAPLAYMANAKGPLKAVTAMAANPPEHLMNVIGTKEFVSSRRIPKWLANKYCTGSLLFCSNPLYFISGGIPNENSLEKSFIARLLYHVPAGGSTHTIMHYTQLVNTAKFHKFNDTNDEFDLKQVILPIVLFSSDDDWLATVPDVLRLYFSIANPLDHYLIRSKNFSHTDFVWGQEADTLVFNKIFEYLDSGLNWFSLKNNEVHDYTV